MPGHDSSSSSSSTINSMEFGWNDLPDTVTSAGSHEVENEIFDSKNPHLISKWDPTKPDRVLTPEERLEKFERWAREEGVFGFRVSLHDPKLPRAETRTEREEWIHAWVKRACQRRLKPEQLARLNPRKKIFSRRPSHPIPKQTFSKLSLHSDFSRASLEIPPSGTVPVVKESPVPSVATFVETPEAEAPIAIATRRNCIRAFFHGIAEAVRSTFRRNRRVAPDSPDQDPARARDPSHRSLLASANMGSSLSVRVPARGSSMELPPASVSAVSSVATVPPKKSSASGSLDETRPGVFLAGSSSSALSHGSPSAANADPPVPGPSRKRPRKKHKKRGRRRISPE